MIYYFCREFNKSEMKKLSILLMMVLGLGLFTQSCNDGKTYAELKEEEREAILRFIEKNDIKVIDEDQFEAQDSMTNVAANEFVLFEETGVYMQVTEKGNGEQLEDGRHEMLVRYMEKQIVSDGTTDTLSFNTNGNWYPHPDEFIVTKQDNSLSASFGVNGAMYEAHGSAYVPAGWLLPLNYLKVGREISGRSKVKLILPHSQGTSTASGQVFPCYYEITYQLSR